MSLHNVEHEKPEIPLAPEAIDSLRRAGYAIVPLQPTEAMICAGAPVGFLPYDGSWELARHDALECYQAMVEVGRL